MKIRPGDVVRTTKAYEGFHYGGVVMRTLDGLAWIYVDGVETPFPTRLLIKAEPIALSLAKLEQAVAKQLDDGYAQRGDTVEISRDTWNAVLAVFRKTRWPTGIPKTRPMVVQLEESDPASWWKVV